jgi:hypothetical protein
MIIKIVTHLADLRYCNTVEINGNIETVDQKYLKFCPFMGWTYKGQQYREGITKVIFKVPTIDGYRYE